MSIYLLSPTTKEGTISLPMIEFRLLDVLLDFTNIDMLMFTSKQAVKSAEALNKKWKNYPCLAIGKSTAKMITSRGGKVAHQAKDFYAKSLSEDIMKLFKDKTILYLRPESISFDAKAFLHTQGLVLEEKIIYKTTCIPYSYTDKPAKNAMIIFTSPSTIKCFLENFTWDISYVAIVIGKATQKHLPKNALYEVADFPTIEACVLKAQSFKRLKNIEALG